MKRAERQVRGAAVPYHEPTSTDDDDVDVDDDASPVSPHDVVSSMSTSPPAHVPSWPSTPSTPTSQSSTVSSGRRALSPPPLELSARTLLWSGSVSSPPGSPPPLPAVYLPQSAVDVKRQSLAALAETGDVDGLKAALKLDASLVHDTDEVSYRARSTRHDVMSHTR